jgi:RHS repeat-associated protein
MYNVREPDGWLLCSFDAAETPNKYYYHFDNLGSTVLVTNGSATVFDSFTYGAWGDVLNSPTGNRYQYVGQLGYYAHTSTQGTALADLMQLGVRLYDPETGLFTQRDIRVTGTTHFIYTYASDDPLLYVDPLGLSHTKKFCLNTYAQWLTDNKQAFKSCINDIAKNTQKCYDKCDLVFGWGGAIGSSLCSYVGAWAVPGLTLCYEGCVAAAAYGISGCTKSLDKSDKSAESWFGSCMKTAK